jgi:hypothetical protein
VSQVLNGFGELRARAGAIDEALDLLRESMNRADETEDLGLRIAVRYGLAISLFWGARLPECRAIVEETIELAQGDVSLGAFFRYDDGAHRIGFSPSLAASNLRGMILSLTGRLRDGAGELDRVLERTLPQLGMGWGPHVFYVLRCEVTGEGASALAHARNAVEYAEQMGNQFGRVASYLCLGIANVLNRAWHGALEALEQALAIGRERRLLAWESSVLARIAVAHLGLGDREKALALARKQLLSAADAAADSASSRLYSPGCALSVRAGACRRRVRSRPRSPKPPPGSRCLARRATRLSSTSSARSWLD